MPEAAFRDSYGAIYAVDLPAERPMKRPTKRGLSTII
jgi:hypothetical protein